MSTHSRKTILLATDQQRSVLNAIDANQPNAFAYTPYGHRPAEHGLLSLLGFNGEPPDPVTGHYHLGKGYREFNPVLMRFNSPDSWSPFGRGGLNAYAYCSGDPVNLNDPTGHIKVPTLIFDEIFQNSYELVTNRKTYRDAHFSTAKSLVEKGKTSRLPPLKKGEDVKKYLEKADTHISQLVAQRNTNRELLKTPEYLQHLSPPELKHLKLNKMDVKKELSHSIKDSITFRDSGPSTSNFNIQKWTQAAIRKGT